MNRYLLKEGDWLRVEFQWRPKSFEYCQIVKIRYGETDDILLLRHIKTGNILTLDVWNLHATIVTDEEIVLLRLEGKI
jgi:hypothetical protein